jgi:hypothetical protein
MLLVPVAALAAVAIFDRAPATQDIQTVRDVPPPIEMVSDDSLAGDVASACGNEGMKLVELEKDGSITDVQQAALDALRPICSDQGQPLPAGVVANADAGTVFVTVAGPGASAPTAPSTDEQEHEEQEHEEHEDEDREGEDQTDEDHVDAADHEEGSDD